VYELLKKDADWYGWAGVRQAACGNVEKQTASEYQNPPRPIKFQWIDLAG
jgi:hypothetical protein